MILTCLTKCTFFLTVGKFYITARCVFDSLDDLVHHYQEQADGLGCQLSNICPKFDAPGPKTVGLTYNTKDVVDIERSTIHLKKKLGAGQFGEVWEGVWNEVMPVAVKILKPGGIAIQEVQNIKKIRHRHLVQLYAVCAKEEPVYIITELVKNGNLHDYLRGEGRCLKLPQLIDICSQVASGMAHLEEHHCIHGNLAARNVLVGDNYNVKIADFGLARVINDEHTQCEGRTFYPIKWTAPEAVLFNHFSIKSDVWSFGIFMFEVITHGRFPYPGMTNAEVLEKVPQGYRMPSPPNCPDHIYNTMEQCWLQDPQERCTFEYIQFNLEDYYVSILDNSYRHGNFS